LRRIHVQPRLNGILLWEGVLIDAIGVFIAILCFEWIIAGEGGAAAWHFVARVLAGTGLGIAGGWFIDFAIRRRIVPESLVNSFALAAAVLGFGITE
jgi:NhaP-type Na+/H+ or K+/H+ antiporter